MRNSKIIIADGVRNQISKWEEIYGKFDQNNYKSYNIKLDNTSGCLVGIFTVWVKTIDPKPNTLLLDGEENSSKESISQIMGIKNVFTAGLGDTDYNWNFEHEVSIIDKFDVIISQAMLEHLIDPYKHVKDLVGLLNSGGYLMTHAAMAYEVYHRYPIHCMGFYPDWFEEVAKRLRLSILKRAAYRYGLFYLFKKD